MMSIDYINQLADEAATVARRRKIRPKVFGPILLARFGEDGGPTIPNLGSYRPAGWRIEEHKLCDSSGMGSPTEPALTLSQLKAWIGAHPESGFATIQAGQFQVVVGRFARTTGKRTR